MGTTLGRVYYDEGRWEEVEKLFVGVMETRKTKLRADHKLWQNILRPRTVRMEGLRFSSFSVTRFSVVDSMAYTG